MITEEQKAPIFWNTNRRYNAYSDHLKQTFGGRVQKVSINADFTCPNRDGSLGRGGCTFCNNESFTPSYVKQHPSITDQLNEGLKFLKQRYKRTAHFVGYFQSYTNTYGSLEAIKKVYDEALSHPDIDGLVIGTRPDCITNEQLDYLQELAKKYIIVLEFGIESCYNDTLESVNRGHTFEDAVDAIQRAVGRGFHVGGHLMFGFPNDSRERMLEQVTLINELPMDSIKFHQLQIVKGTVMAKQYKDYPEQFDFFGVEDYIDFVINFVERMRPDLQIQRFTSEAPPSIKIAPHWGMMRGFSLLEQIEKRMEERDTWQGKYYTK
ncbi:TIGR01212 family radical SAM protein [Persicobacter psychrovividus]|uniref:TIGR01212 family radical SAM protein n=1 Tax=Persicobacter psychrovividus TaxID=387638 RepID=A0ABN6L5J2_9BACT|nr:TIGR01212 family radical SAM protein [Persicobacter psychrovividus]